MLDGLIFQIYQDLRTCLTTYNDSLVGRCSVCLEPFCKDEAEMESSNFTDRVDLVRIDGCFHRFHTLCVYRDWFMERATEEDEHGYVQSFDLPEIKKCPICRCEASEDDIMHI